MLRRWRYRLGLWGMVFASTVFGAIEPPLEKLAEDLKSSDMQVQAQARQVLSRKGPEAISVVLPLLHDKNPAVAQAAFDVLKYIGNMAAVPGREADCRQVVDQLMVLLQTDLSEQDRITGLRLLERIIPAGYDMGPIGTMLREKGELRDKARAALVRIATPEARAALREALREADPAFQCALLNSLGELCDRDGLKLVQELTTASDAAVRVAAARALAWTGDPVYLPVVYEVIRKADEPTRFTAFDALLRLTQAMADKGGNWQIVRAVYIDMLKNGEGVQKDAALAGLGTIGDASCVDPVLEAIKDTDTRTWLVGIDALRRMQGPGPARVLVERYPALDETTQLALVPVLMEQKHPRVLPALKETEQTDAAAIREAILRVLSESASPQSRSEWPRESTGDGRTLASLLMFDKRKLSPNAFEAAAAFDVNNDGVIDIVSGACWYEGPDFVTAHKICDIPYISEYHDDFCDYPMDVNGDGYLDIVTGGWFGETVRWRENPRGLPVLWTTHDVDKCGNIETMRCWDVDGDGHVEAVPNAGGNIVAYRLVRDATGKGTGRFEKHVLKEGGVGHGLGFGDINGDGRNDFVSATGWLEAPKKPFEQKWTWHPDFEMGLASVPIIVHDVNGDGVADLIAGGAHGYGIAWYEQKIEGSKRTWTMHVIDTDHSQYHDLVMADIDRDGKDELITGKRYRAHNGKDPGENDPLFLCYFKIDGGRFDRFTIDYGPAGRTSGVGIYFWMADLDGNGWLDIIAPGKDGLFLFRNHGFGQMVQRTHP